MSWTLATPDQVAKAFPDAELRGTDIRLSLAEGAYALPGAQKLGALTFTFDASARGFIEGYDAPADVDAAGVVGTGREETALAPPLVFGADRAWLKYAVEARVKADLGVEVPYASLAGNGDVRVLLADYHLHAQGDNARAALARDALSLRLPLLPESIGRLGVGEAMSLQARGQLSLSASLGWSDVFTSNLRAVTELLSASTLVALETQVGAALSATLRVTDDYVVIFSRPEPGRVRVQVKKTVAREAGFTPGLKVSVALPDSDALVSRIDGLVSSLLATPVARFEGLIKELATGALSPDDQETLRFVLERLGLEELESQPAALSQAWKEHKDKLVERIRRALKQKLEAGFTYEYLRVREGTTLFSVLASDAQAMALHRPLREGDLSAALQVLQRQGLALEQCLLQELTRETWALGFSLKLGGWELGGSERGELKEVVQRSSLEKDAPRRISFLGARSYRGSLLAPYSFWTADFKADMREFRAEPTVADFDFGLYLLLRGESRRLGDKELRHAVDEAVIWRALDDADAEEVFLRIREALGDRPLETRVELKFDDRTTRGLFEQARAPDAHLLFARALARALPWYGAPCRERPTIRESVYASLWRDCLEQNWSASDAARAAAARLKKDPLVGYFATVEGKLGEGQLTFAEVLQKNPGTPGKWRGLRNGLLHLRNGLVQQRLPSVIRESFQELSPLWSTSFHLKAAGAFFLELALRSETGLAAVERTFTVVTPEGTQLVFSKSRG